MRVPVHDDIRRGARKLSKTGQVDGNTVVRAPRAQQTANAPRKGGDDSSVQPAADVVWVNRREQ